MKKYRVHTESGVVSRELETLEEAKKEFENWKDYLMSESVTADESFVEIVVSEDGFEDYTVIKKVIAVIDNDRTELGTPKEEGFDWEYWAKWQEVSD